MVAKAEGAEVGRCRCGSEQAQHSLNAHFARHEEEHRRAIKQYRRKARPILGSQERVGREDMESWR